MRTRGIRLHLERAPALLLPRYCATLVRALTYTFRAGPWSTTGPARFSQLAGGVSVVTSAAAAVEMASTAA